MPTISVKKRLLDKHLSVSLSQQQVDDLCFQYGLEVDDVLVEKDEKTGQEEEVYKIEIPANRYDLLCVEGLARALLIFQNKITPPVYSLTNPPKTQKIVVDQSVSAVRPFVVGAILRDVHFDADAYASFIDLQDKLHQNIGRKRTLASMGTHDLDTIKGPFKYCALPPRDIVFKPLNQSREMNAAEQMELYSESSHLREYLHIIRDKPLYPVILDADGVVCSMPPIINSEHSKITLNTRNIFIEVTGTDLVKLEIVLDMLVTMFSQYCTEQFNVEPVQIVQPNGTFSLFPKLDYRDHLVDVLSLAAKIGISDIGADKAVQLLSKMALECVPIKDEEKPQTVDIGKALELLKLTMSGEEKRSEKALNGDEVPAVLVKVTVPPTRHDILHECDLAEDLALAFGYNAIPTALPQSNTVAEPFPLNKLSDQLRLQLAISGWTEVLTFALCSTEDVGSKMLRPDHEMDSVVRISNPKTIDFQVARNSLLPGILKTIANNKDMALPLRLFEVQDVVFIDESKDTKCRNERHLAAIFYSKSGSFEVIHGLLDRIMQMLGIAYERNDSEPSVGGYRIVQSDDPSYFDGRCANVLFRNECVGTFGVLHPTVLANFALTNPCSALELNIEPFLV
ncbi:hypothetical protein niasHS_001636 [Heterodera schachtii]|uniref:Phenylalanine--tRNA ligase beta subunit n=1 Tax=Heterodera schachtii TaxID=97005 RepID=A0ABD2KE47_HETSC